MQLDPRPKGRHARPLDEQEEHVVRRVLVRCGLRGPDLEDSVQEVRLRALRFAPPEQPLSPWVARVAHNVAMDHHRAVRRRREVAVRLAPLVTPASAPPDVATHLALSAALRRMRPEHRDVLVLRFLSGLSTKEAAAVLNLPEGTVKSRAHRALAALRAELGGEEDLPWTA